MAAARARPLLWLLALGYLALVAYLFFADVRRYERGEYVVMLDGDE